MKRMTTLLLIALTLGACTSDPVYTEPTWFVFSPDENFAGSVIDRTAWLDAPAGKHGFVTMNGDDFAFEDGTPVKFWGVNICSSRPYSDQAMVDQWVKQLAHYGVNGVRYHKFTQDGLSDKFSDQITEEKWERLDYFQAKLREAGIYYGWSPIYGHKTRPGDKKRLLAYDELIGAEMNSHLSQSTIGLVNFAKDLQDLHIDLIVNMLEHVNPITGLRYADDPALSFVELQNEDDIWFATADRMMELCPTYKKLHQKQFAEWLREKYTNQEGLAEAWGEEAFVWGREVRKEEWNLDKANITPVCSHGIYGYEYSKYAAMDTVMPLFLRDNAYFLYLEQLDFYNRFVEAIRQTGYRGPIVGSCWQAGEGITHYYNLHTDYVAGFIDRHNYFGGGTGHRMVPGKMNNRPMVSSPGSGLLNTGKQMVTDRPFAISEWMSLPPNEWIAEGPAIISIYGMGLNDWDASYAFASDYPHFTPTIHTPGVYNVTAPTQLTLYPAIASMIYRNDIKEGAVVSTRKVHLPSLHDGIVGFDENVRQQMDVKEFTGIPPNEAFAVGKVVLEFTENYEETKTPDLSANWDTLSKTIVSNTGEITWDYSEKGIITLNTSHTKAFVGFAGGKSLRAGDASISIETPFSVIFITSNDKEKGLDQCESILVTAIARAENSNMKFNDDKTELLDPGTAPILMEPVQFELSPGRKIKEVRILDHVGKPTGETLEVNKKQFLFDGALYKTCYYEVIL